MIDEGTWSAQTACISLLSNCCRSTVSLSDLLRLISSAHKLKDARGSAPLLQSPPTLPHPRRQNQTSTNQRARPRPNLRRNKTAPIPALQRPTNRRPRQRRKTHSRKRHPQPRAHHAQIRRQTRHRSRDQALEGCAHDAEEDGEGVVPGGVVDGEPAVGYYGEAEEGGEEDVEGAVAVGEEGRDDAGGEADAVDDYYEARG